MNNYTAKITDKNVQEIRTYENLTLSRAIEIVTASLRYLDYSYKKRVFAEILDSNNNNVKFKTLL